VLAEVDELVREASAGAAQLRIGYAWSALGRHTVAFQRRWSELRPDSQLQLLRVNSPTAGLAEGLCDLAVVRRQPEDRRLDSVIVGLERRLCAMAADDPLARRRSLRLTDLSERILLVDHRTGTTTAGLWPEGARPVTQETADVEDWLTSIAAGRYVGVTAEATANQYPRPGVVYRPVRDAEPIAVRLAWWCGERHPATTAVIELLTDLYRARLDPPLCTAEQLRAGRARKEPGYRCIYPPSAPSVQLKAATASEIRRDQPSSMPIKSPCLKAAHSPEFEARNSSV
jgi:LysR substrate binding domain-containing protein